MGKSDRKTLLNNNNLKNIHDHILSKSNYGKKKIVVFNIGTDRHIGDSFGPLLGQMLRERNYKHIKIYGDLQHPIHALNVNEKIDKVLKKHKRDFIIATDACLTDIENSNNHRILKKIFVQDKPIQPGKGVGKELKTIGDIKLVYCIDETSDQFFSSRSYRLNEVYKKCRQAVKLFDMIEDTLEKQGGKR